VSAGGFELEQSAEQILRGFADQNGVRRRQRLEPCGQIGRFTDDRPLLRGTGADDFADNDKAGGDTDPCLQRGALPE
jgi:hypothetical protein